MTNTPAPVAQTDDEAVAAFAELMRKKLAKKRNDGRSGWQECDPGDLAYMLVEHIAKGDPVDIANFAMFLGLLGKPRSDIRRALRDGLESYVATQMTVKVTT